MTGLTEIQVLLKEMKPNLDRTEYIFTTMDCFNLNEDIIRLNPIATFLETEGMTVVITKKRAEQNNIAYDAVFNKITLEVHSSLEAVGLTAAFSSALTVNNISANVIAGYYHDHIFVPIDNADQALATLIELTR